MTDQFENAQRMGQEQVDAVKSSGASVSRGLQAIALETAEFSKRYLESLASYTEKLAGARSVEKLIQLQTEFAKTQLEALTSQAAKVSNIYQDIAKEAFQPVQTAYAKGKEIVEKSQ